MGPIRPHKKSRTGCRTCRSRRVKVRRRRVLPSTAVRHHHHRHIHHHILPVILSCTSILIIILLLSPPHPPPPLPPPLSAGDPPRSLRDSATKSIPSAPIANAASSSASTTARRRDDNRSSSSSSKLRPLRRPHASRSKASSPNRHRRRRPPPPMPPKPSLRCSRPHGYRAPLRPLPLTSRAWSCCTTTRYRRTQPSQRTRSGNSPGATQSRGWDSRTRSCSMPPSPFPRCISAS